MVERRSDDLLRSRIRFSSLDEHLFVHSAYPTEHRDSVFFGPDTYRFCAALEHARGRRVVDLGAGTGAGGITCANRCERITLTDCNPLAVAFARVNATLAGCGDRVEVVIGDMFETVTGDVDLVVSNPPYIADEAGRRYCDGGDGIGTEVALRIIDDSLRTLSKGGTLMLYTGSPIQRGVDPVREAARRLVGSRVWTYRELDPDVFGEELDRDAYRDVERIAAVLLTVTV
ncbi:MAG: methyltransferase [Kofleriaceae bacterium]